MSEVDEIVERLKTKALQHFEKMLDAGAISGTDMATLVRLLAANGWVLDSTKLGTGLASKLGERVDPLKFDDDDADVVGRIA